MTEELKVLSERVALLLGWLKPGTAEHTALLLQGNIDNPIRKRCWFMRVGRCGVRHIAQPRYAIDVGACFHTLVPQMPKFELTRVEHLILDDLPPAVWVCNCSGRLIVSRATAVTPAVAICRAFLALKEGE